MTRNNDCQDRYSAITALVLGVLDGPAADEIKQHLHACRNCRELYEALREEEKTVRSTFKAVNDRSKAIQDNLIAQFDIGSRVNEDTSGALPESEKHVLSEVEGTKQAHTELSKWRILMRSRISQLAAAAVIIIAAFLIIYLFGGSIDGSNVVWADVLEQIRTFRPYVFRETIKYDGRPADTKRFMRLSLSRRREIRSDGSIWVFDMSEKPLRRLTLYPDKKRAQEMTITDMEPAKDPDLLRIIGKRQDGAEEELGIKQIDGRTVKGFHSPGKLNDFTIWADVETQLPVYVKVRQDGLKRTIIGEDFEFDVDFDPSLFSTTSPEGYSVEKVEKKGYTSIVSIQQMIERSTFETYVLSKKPSWTRNVQIVEVSDPVRSDSDVARMYYLIALADDGRHLVIAQSNTISMMLGQKIKQSQSMYTSANGLKVWSGGPLKWHSQGVLERAEYIIKDPPSEERVGYAIETPEGTFPVLAVNGPITDEELHSLVESFVPAKEYSKD